MSLATIVCPHCGKADWSRAPRLRRVYDYVRGCPKSGRTARELADDFGLSIANASNHLARLVALGVVRRDEAEPHPSGGLYHTYYATGVKL